MATTWTYSGWRSESGATAQRAMLILHMQEVSDAIAAFASQGALSQRAERFNLVEYLNTLQTQLDKLDIQTGNVPGDDNPFVFGKARMPSQ